jgi:mevalonate kinase
MGPRGASGSAPGKLILFGEHAVVWGWPALAGAVDRRTFVDLVPGGAGRARIEADLLDARLLEAVARFVPPGLTIRIRSELPVGRGMGSSAALSVALVRALAAWRQQVPSFEDLAGQSLDVDRIFHGTPSGVDTTVSLCGGLVRFRKGPPVEIRPVVCPAPLPVVVLDSGSPGDTAAMVARVRLGRPGVDSVLRSLGEAVDPAIACLGDLEALGACMDEFHLRLGKLGVSTPRLDEIAAFARAHGALGAKLSGAGGGGVLVALTRPGEQEKLVDEATAAGIGAFAVVIGT